MRSVSSRESAYVTGGQLIRGLSWWRVVILGLGPIVYGIVEIALALQIRHLTKD